jgi:outer membrane lipoprotein SlyB
LYVTNEQKLYVGDGSLLGGIQITGYTDNDAKDSAAAIFTDGSHSGLTFSYNTSTNIITAAVNLSNYAGVIRADAFKGSVFADDGSTIGGTVLVDAVDGVLRGPHIGTLTGNVTGNVTGNLTGNVTGNLTGTVTGNLTGNVAGDIKGSLFGEDSSTIVDATDGSIRTNFITHISGEVSIGSESEPVTSAVTGLTEYPFAVRSISDGTTPPNIGLFISNGTLTAPTSVSPGDDIGGFIIRSYDGNVFKSTFGMSNQIDADANMSDDAPLSNLTMAVAGSGSDFATYTLRGNGTFQAPVLRTTNTYTTSPDNRPGTLGAIDLAVGMIIFETTTNTFQGWNGTNWTTLG